MLIKMAQFKRSFINNIILCTIICNASASDYWKAREELLLKEKSLAVGGNLVLNTAEIQANKIFLHLKKKELYKAHLNDSDFLPGQHFFRSRDKILASKVFKFIRKMPKGACLHTHLTASAPLEFVLNITGRRNLYGCDRNGTFQLRFFSEERQTKHLECKPLEGLKTNDSFHAFLKRHLSLVVDNPEVEYASIELVWSRFKSIFSTLYYMLSYRPVFEDYLFEALNELYQDNVFYVEFRGTVLPMYELNETTYSPVEYIGIMQNAVEKFKKNHPGFIGARFIYAPYRGADNATFTNYLSILKEIKAAHPNFVAGFDLIGYEDKTRPLRDFVDELQQTHQDVQLFLHAGETNWYGSTDVNLIDAVLLNTSRIGHGLALQKHPEVLEVVKERGIAIEITPISKQVLKFVDDLRNHPAVGLISRGYPVVVGNDDPGLWDASGLSFDFYVVIMAMTSEDAGLEVLKQLALNSIQYSAMQETEKNVAFKVFEEQWKRYIDDFIMTYIHIYLDI